MHHVYGNNIFFFSVNSNYCFDCCFIVWDMALLIECILDKLVDKAFQNKAFQMAVSMVVVEGKRKVVVVFDMHCACYGYNLLTLPLLIVGQRPKSHCFLHLQKLQVGLTHGSVCLLVVL